MITFTGFDARYFDYVLKKFANMFDAFTPFLDGKIARLMQNTCWYKRMIHPEDCLRFVFCWTRTHGSMMALQLIFGITMTNLLMYLCFRHWLIVEIFNPHDLAAIKRKKLRNIKELFMPNISFGKCLVCNGWFENVPQTNVFDQSTQAILKWMGG